MVAHKSKLVRSKTPGPLIVLSVFLFASALVRVAGEATPVFAAAPDKGVEALPDQTNSDTFLDTSPTDDEINGMLRAFQERDARLRDLERQLEDRQRAVDIAEQAINQRLQELVAAEDNLRATLALASTAVETDLAQLTLMYEQMKPKEAAVLFEAMAPDFAAGFLSRMKPDAAAAVLAGLDAQIAYSISAIMAGRHADVPNE